MGAYKPVEAFFEPFVSFARYLPASAFIPLLILWAGIGELQKLLVIFIGSLFQIVLMVAVSVGSDAARPGRGRLHAGRRRPRHRPARADAGAARREIAETLRLVLGWAWTYVIVAELIGSSSGIGHMITDSQALLATGQIIFGIIVIGVIGLVSDFAFKAAQPLAVSLGAWRERRCRIERRRRAPLPACRGGAPIAALQPIDLAVADNDFITILGPPAAASRRCCASSPGSTRRARAACCSTASR